MTPERKERLEAAAQHAFETMKAKIADDVLAGDAQNIGPQVALVATRNPNTGVELDEPVVGIITPRLILRPDGTIPNKSEFMATVKALAIASRAYAAVIGMEAWSDLVSLSERKNLPESMADWPEHLRQESATVLFEKPSFFQRHYATIKRESGAVKLEPWVVEDSPKSAGRMTRIIPERCMN